MKMGYPARLILLFTLSMALLGCRVSPPSRVETKAVYWTKQHITIGGKKDVNPVPVQPENIADGQQIFNSYCIVCHGLDGQNTGVPFATSVSPPIPSLASREVQAYTDGQLKWIIKNGIYPSGMPSSDKEFSDDDMWRMVLYIRHLPKAGSLGEPAVYGGSGKMNSGRAGVFQKGWRRRLLRTLMYHISQVLGSFN